MNRFWSLLVMMCGLIIFDQLTKGAIQSNFYWGESLPVWDGLFNFTYVRNTGAAWGMGQGVPEWARVILFLVFPVFACCYLLYWLIKTIKGPIHLSLALSLILAGAIGNLFDRFYLGYVVDFLDFYYKGSHFPAFNVADSCITVGGFLLAYEFLIDEPKRKKQSIKA